MSLLVIVFLIGLKEKKKNDRRYKRNDSQNELSNDKIFLSLRSMIDLYSREFRKFVPQIFSLFVILLQASTTEFPFSGIL
jgi:hypothetical protein